MMYVWSWVLASVCSSFVWNQRVVVVVVVDGDPVSSSRVSCFLTLIFGNVKLTKITKLTKSQVYNGWRSDLFTRASGSWLLQWSRGLIGWL